MQIKIQKKSANHIFIYTCIYVFYGIDFFFFLIILIKVSNTSLIPFPCIQLISNIVNLGNCIVVVYSVLLLICWDNKSSCNNDCNEERDKESGESLERNKKNIIITDNLFTIKKY